MSAQLFCNTIGVHRLPTRQDGPYLSERLLEPNIQKYIMKELKVEENKPTGGARKKNNLPVKIKYLMGQGISVDTPEEAADLLLKREYPELTNDLLNFGTITVPEGFIPTITKVVDQDIIDKLEFECEKTEKKYKDMIKKFPGDFAERIAFEAIKKFYKERKNTVIVQGLEIINLSKPGQHRESDFIIVNVDKKYILNLEVKHFLGSWNKNQAESSKVNNSTIT